MLTPIGRFHFTFARRRSRTGKDLLGALERSRAGRRIRLVPAALGHNSTSVSRATECSREHCTFAITHLSFGRQIRSRREDSRALDRLDDRVLNVARCDRGRFSSRRIRGSVVGTSNERARHAATSLTRHAAQGQCCRYHTLAGHVAGSTHRGRSTGCHREGIFIAKSRTIGGWPWAIAGDGGTLRHSLGMVHPVTSTFTLVAPAKVVCIGAGRS